MVRTERQSPWPSDVDNAARIYHAFYRYIPVRTGKTGYRSLGSGPAVSGECPPSPPIAKGAWRLVPLPGGREGEDLARKTHGAHRAAPALPLPARPSNPPPLLPAPALFCCCGHSGHEPCYPGMAVHLQPNQINPIQFRYQPYPNRPSLDCHEALSFLSSLPPPPTARRGFGLDHGGGARGVPGGLGGDDRAGHAPAEWMCLG